MQYALVNNIRSEARKGSQGICSICTRELIAKCGPRNIHHWAHKHITNCDPWWENETQWHRDWKNQFSEEWREISHLSEKGEIHRSDVKTANGIVIEIQNSPMSDEERISREKFYKNLVWIVNGEKFNKNFDIYHCLPNPDLEIAKDLVWYKSIRSQLGSTSGMFWKRSENPNIEAIPGAMVLAHFLSELKNDTKNSPSDYFQYDWIRPRSTWLEGACPVYMDFGDEYLVLLEKYPHQKSLSCVRLISKKLFIHNAKIKDSANDLASRFLELK
jgi:competence protein CoiA